jgi:general stress protein YciG
MRTGNEKVKQKELQEYLRVQYKGDLPDHLKGTVNDMDNSDTDREYPPTGHRDRNKKKSQSEKYNDDRNHDKNISRDGGKHGNRKNFSDDDNYSKGLYLCVSIRIFMCLFVYLYL